MCGTKRIPTAVMVTVGSYRKGAAFQVSGLTIVNHELAWGYPVRLVSRGCNTRKSRLEWRPGPLLESRLEWRPGPLLERSKL